MTVVPHSSCGSIGVAWFPKLELPHSFLPSDAQHNKTEQEKCHQLVDNDVDVGATRITNFGQCDTLGIGIGTNGNVHFRHT